VLTRCAAAVATLPVIARQRPDACLVWFDAHADLNSPTTTPSGYLGGMVLAAATDLWRSELGGGLPFSRLVLVGVRDVDPFEQHLIATSGLRHICVDTDVAAQLRRATSGRPVYVHVDVDVLDAGLVSSEFAVRGGLSWAQLEAACTALSETDVVGLELAELERRDAVDDDVRLERLLEALTPLIELWT